MEGITEDVAVAMLIAAVVMGIWWGRRNALIRQEWMRKARAEAAARGEKGRCNTPDPTTREGEKA